MKTMPQRAFGKKVQHRAATVAYPIDRLLAVNESQHLYLLQHVNGLGISTNHPDSLLLTFRHSRRCHFDTVDIDVAEQHPRYHQFLVRHETHTVCLFTIAQC